MTSPTGRPTQADVARLAGVSQTTVSLVISGRGVSESRVSSDVRKRVLAAIDEIGYKVNPIAQGLVGGRTSIIGVHTSERVFPSDSNDFYAPFLEGIERRAEEVGVDLLMFTSTQRQTPRSMSASGMHRLVAADGCILLGRRSYPEDFALLLQRRYPFATIGRRECDEGQIPYVAADYRGATGQVVRHLVRLGHKRIALLSEDHLHVSVIDRRDGYLQAMRQAGLTPRVVNVPDADYEASCRAVLDEQTTALIVMANNARFVQHALERLGVRVPESVSLARLGEPLREEATPETTWTGFKMPRFEMGEAVLDVVLRQIDPQWDGGGERAFQVTIPCKFVAGTTTGAVI